MALPAPYDLDNLNLDCMTLADLEATEVALDCLHAYAVNKVQEMRLRLAGWMSQAMLAERTCQMYYDNLPDNWKW